MKIAIIILSVLVALLYLKWVLIVLVFPFQAIHGQVLKRYMLYQVGLIPSHHVRRFIGENVNISSNVSIYCGSHNHQDPFFGITPRSAQHPVTIGNRAWISSNAIIVNGVNIGEGAVCCAGCVVTKDVEPYAVVAGIPARIIGERPRDLRYAFDGKSQRLY